MPPLSKLDSSLPKLARELATKGPYKTLPTPRRIRLLLNGQYVADSIATRFVWEHKYYPQYYLPTKAFNESFVTHGEEIKAESGDGAAVARLWTLDVDGKSTGEVLEMLAGELKGFVKVEFSVMDTWLEEDTPIYVHPKDPFKRVDIVHSTRRIRISLDGKTVADTTSAFHLYETGLPVRYYMPLTAVEQSVLRPSGTRTKCPYKGEAEYYSVVLGGKEWKDVVWYYTRPTVECAAIQGLVCFYNEKVEVEVDGKQEQRETTPWS
ncbi:DUF427-domain-containing protein [Myriangium duriaei CBS 260.36]|uniref:DUF427-domain-containing protein n=1 Tax=Myriangium duriaei CBS 260.36 TaxID=1168546 RepID=A0A9P4IVX4_9PEZI|nr:DUF427-domain-containing protein [Myriangium duriaei CBS 260.36]